MNKFDLPEHFVQNPEALIKRTRAKLRRVTEPSSSTSQLKAQANQEDHPNIVSDFTSEFNAMVEKSICELSAPTTDNIRTRPAADIDRSFELKPTLINMVQASQFCGKPHEDASAQLPHFLEIYSTFTIKDIPKDAILLRLFPFSLLERVK